MARKRMQIAEGAKQTLIDKPADGTESLQRPQVNWLLKVIEDKGETCNL
ncbi:MAG: hypothetical protein AAF693_15105 [Bacteroidota bacterium]